MSSLVSVIIPTRERPQTLARVLDGLCQQTFPASDFEVVVVLDGPCAQTQALLKRGSFPFVLRWFAQPACGAPSARNLGIREARGELLVFLDDDIIPVPDLLALHWRRHALGDRVVLGGLRPSPDSPQRFMAEVGDWTLAHFNRCSAPGYKPSHMDLPDGNMSARKDDIVRAGGWDEAFVGFGGDDDRELGLRLARLGLQFEFEPQALGYHFYAKSWHGYLKDRRQVGRAHRYYMSKHPDHVRELLFAMWATGSWMERASFWVAGHLPNFLLSAFSSLVAFWGENFDPRWGRAALRWVVKASGRAFYARGFWDDQQASKSIWRQLQLKVPILAYHRVAPEAMPGSPLTVSVTEFERQMRYLAMHGYRTISLHDFSNWQDRLTALPPKPVILTFDDGYEGFREHAAPILAPHGFVATVFVIAGKVGGEVCWDGHPPLKIMHGKEVAELAREGFDIQSHGVLHHDWTRIAPQALRQELIDSVKIIESITARRVRFVAYPFGRWVRDVRDLVEATGFAGACTILPGRNDFNQDRFLLGRSLVLPGRGIWRFVWGLQR